MRNSIAGQVLQGSFYSVTASVVTLFLGLTRSILLARLLLPEHFGVVTLAMFYIGLVSRLKGFGFDSAIIHRQTVNESTLKTYFSLHIGLDILVYSLLVALIPLLQRFYPDMPTFSAVMPLLILAYILGDLSNVQVLFMRKALNFRPVAVMDVISSLLMTIIAPFLAWQGWGIWALVAEQLIGLGSRFVVSWTLFRQWWPGFGWDRSVVNWFWNYGKPNWVAGNLSYLLDTFDDFWIGTTLGKVQLGYYAKAYEFARYPRRIFANPLVQVFGPTFAKLQDNRLALSRAFYRSAYIIIRTGFFGAGLFSLLMPEFIQVVIGDKWLPMLWTFRLMLIYTLLDSIVMLIGNLFLVTGQPHVLQKTRLIQAVLFVPAVILGAYLWGINGVALAANGMLIVGLWGYYPPLKRLVDFSMLRLVGWPFLALGLAIGAGFGLESVVSSNVSLVILLKIGVFCLVFITTLLLSEGDEFITGSRWLWQIIKNRRQGLI